MKALDVIVRGSASPIRNIGVALHSGKGVEFFSLPVSERREFRVSHDKLSEAKREEFKVLAKKLHNEARKIVAGRTKLAQHEFKRSTNELRQYFVTEAKNGARSAFIKFRDESQMVVTDIGKATLAKKGKEKVDEEVKAAVDALNDAGVTKLEAGKFKITPAADALLAKAGK